MKKVTFSLEYFIPFWYSVFNPQSLMRYAMGHGRKLDNNGWSWSWLLNGVIAGHGRQITVAIISGGFTGGRRRR